mmetsp:Transcript_29492/g.47419  ORF Transcript_29492/g.47419 Transcript_29492/m.47419 type:complete len:611 (-) Transcript_29492:372-2204(-)
MPCRRRTADGSPAAAPRLFHHRPLPPFLLLLILFVVVLSLPGGVAQGLTPVGDVKDHPVAPPTRGKNVGTQSTETGAPAGTAPPPEDAGRALNLDSMPQEKMQSLFNWAIKNADPQKLREMAAAAARASAEKHGAAGGRAATATAAEAASAAAASHWTADASSAAATEAGLASLGVLPDASTASKVQPGQRWTQEEVLKKRADIRELLDMLSMNPTEQSYIELATDMYLNKTLAVSQRLVALRELEDLVGPVDNANDLHVLGALVPLVATAVDVKEDHEVGAAAAGVLATAMSNNPKVQALVHAWRPPTLNDIPAVSAAGAAGAETDAGVAAAGSMGAAARAEWTGPAEETAAGKNLTSQDSSTDNDLKSRKAAAANVKNLGVYGNIDVTTPVMPTAGVEARLGAIADDPATPAARRSKALFALSAMVRNTLECRRSFLAAGGRSTVEALLRPETPAGVRKKALVLVTDFWILPDVAGGAVYAEEELALATTVMPHVVEMLGRGLPDTREKAMAALRAALVGDGTGAQGRHHVAAADVDADAQGRAAASAAVVSAANKHGAVSALFRLQAFFVAEAKEDPEVEDYMTDMAQEAAALAEMLQARGGSKDEL